MADVSDDDRPVPDVAGAEDKVPRENDFQIRMSSATNAVGSRVYRRTVVLLSPLVLVPGILLFAWIEGSGSAVGDETALFLALVAGYVVWEYVVDDAADRAEVRAEAKERERWERHRDEWFDGSWDGGVR